MLFKDQVLAEIKAGRVTLAFRRWKRPMVLSETRLRTSVGELEILAVDAVDESKVTASEAKRAGFETVATLLDDLRASAGRQLYRVKLRFAGRDRRETLRAMTTLTNDDRAEIDSRLERYDRASRVGPSTSRVLALIAKHPEMSAGELAELSGFEKAWLKVNVRKLKELGLTESLQPGYRLSPRGQAYWARADRMRITRRRP
jgi:DNA-binding MarR family transcriptional regulator